MTYVDGFVLPVPKARLEEYRRMAAEAGRVWMDHGALGFVEAVADDVAHGTITSFPRAVLAPEEGDETVVFAFITYRDRAHRDEVNAKVMADPRIRDSDMSEPPFDAKRMIHGGFRAIVTY